MYWNLLPQIKNALAAKRQMIHVPYSKMDQAVAQILVNAGYLKDVQKKTSGRKSVLELKLSYRDGEPAVSDFKLVSKPSRRFYSGYRNLRSVRQGYGLSVLSTPKGLVTGKDAKNGKIGGEYLFEIW